MDHAVLVHRHRHDQVERLGQELRQRPQERLLGLPARRHRQARHRADPLAGAGRPIGVGPRLEPLQTIEVPARDVQTLAVAHAALRLPFLFGRPNLARIDMKSHRPRVDTILFVDLSPSTAAVRDARLEVVDPVDRRHAAEPAVRLVVDAVPGELVHRAAPDDGLLAAVAEDHDEGVDRRRSVGVAEIDLAELAPVALCLRPERGSRPAGRGGLGAGRSGRARTCGPTCRSRCSRTRHEGIRGGAGRWAAAVSRGPRPGPATSGRRPRSGRAARCARASAGHRRLRRGRGGGGSGPPPRRRPGFVPSGAAIDRARVRPESSRFAPL